MTINWTPGQTLEDVEEIVIKKAFIHFNKNKTATARALGISLRTLDNKFEKYADDDRKRKETDERDAKERREWKDRAKGIPPRSEESQNSTNAGNGVESTKESSSQSSLPLQKSEEVQDVLPTQTTDLRPKRSGGRL